MLYKELSETIKAAVDTFKGQLAYGTGTIEQLNADDNLVYPIVWLLPVNVSNPIAPNGIQLQNWRLNVRVLQTSSLEAKRKTDEQLLDETFSIAEGLVDKLYRTFQDETINTIQISDITQVYRQNDSVHVGWNISMTISSAMDVECCKLFD